MTGPTDVFDASSVNATHPVGWRRDIQGLRGLAILLVVLYHARLPIPGGFVGVDVFFVISGYVITASVMRRVTAGRFSARDFYWRRFRRLIPALSVVVLAVLIISFAFQSPISNQSNTGWMAVGSMLSISNVVILTENG
jgi:peptidoglycan/LPS O-acetylase OafA/YrhL